MKKMKRREFLKPGIGKLHAEDKGTRLAKEEEFQPGEKAKASGVYHVFHDKIDGEHHAQHHQVLVLAGTVFPRCKGCREWVKFRLAQQVESVDRDAHFAHGRKGKVL